MGITSTRAAALKALRALPADQVNGDMNMEVLITKPPTYAGGPIFDGNLVTATPGEMLRRGKAAQVPILIGTTTDDLPVTYPPSRDNPLSYFGPDAERASAVYNPGWTLQTPQLASAVAVDMTMHEPARFVAKQVVSRYGKDMTEKDREIARVFHTYFANFAKTGDPNGGGLPN
jgi:para-nitrobenzyl esterase